ncbi:hypothetical protein LCGC14_1396850 [marine sediment metagenome]|uniref:Uncharacterized protein n=1 Tax=marine sediment metagenome TaxID=412755 RepID=A0A0F9JYI9_9ZZZZ|nr:hypothetical protein [Pricia sp.]
MQSNIKISAYFSHPIQGKKGKDATVKDMQLNNDIAAGVSHLVEQALPVLDLYVPAVHDEYVIEAYQRKSHTIDEILAIDKVILARRDIMIVFAYNGVISNGMIIEIEHAKKLGMPIFRFHSITGIAALVENILNWYYNKHES